MPSQAVCQTQKPADMVFCNSNSTLFRWSGCGWIWCCGSFRVNLHRGCLKINLLPKYSVEV
eukprot:2352491-Amphidinium_carterae.1